MQEAFQHVLQELPVVLEQRRDLVGIGLVSRDVLLGEAEDALDVVRLLGRGSKHLLERLHLERRHDAVRLGHLGRERDDADGEGNVLLGLGAAVQAEDVGKLAEQAAAGIGDRAREPRDLLPGRHRDDDPYRRLPQAGSDCARAQRTANPESARNVKETSWSRLQLTRS